MKWTNIRLIVSREIRDQLRDRRTIFVIAILPLLLYPLLGISVLQVTQFLKEHPTRIWLIGTNGLPNEPALLDGTGFQVDLLTSPDDARLYDLTVEPEVPAGDIREIADQAVHGGQYDAVVVFSEEFAQQIRQIASLDQTSGADGELGPELFFDRAKDKSRVAKDRVVNVLARWRSRLVERTLANRSLPVQAAKPFLVVSQDLSAAESRRAAIWSKILPFIVIIWAMTGAFYPAIDLCAGEKERGTLETLLSCPASRQEIVWGKLFTVMVFSMATSLLNLVSMGLTGRFIFSQLESLGGTAGLQLGPPPLETLSWLVVALIPIAALFSALSLALAAMARSSKEGQYYLMPLMLGTMPLMMLPMLPAVELDLGNSLIPVTGVILLLRNLIEGQYLAALRYALPVGAVTGICCWLAIQWAIHQFQDENVLFHESERFDLISWLVHLVRNRGPIPTVAQAFLCGVLLLLARFFAAFLVPQTSGWNGFVWQTLITQIGLIAAPAVLMALLLTSRPRETLLLRLPRLSHIVAVGLLAIALHPVAAALAVGVHTLYPFSEQAIAQLKPFATAISEASSMWQILALLALVPAICEELAFRGFILSGLRRMKSPLMAVLVSSLFFGIAHTVLQQSLTAFALGLVIGYISIKTRSIYPCILFHFVHNSLQLSAAQWASDPPGWARRLVEIKEPGLVFYAWPLVVFAAVAASCILFWFHVQNRPAGDRAILAGRRAPSTSHG